MRVFRCCCGQVVFFENDRCLRCWAPLGYLHRTRNVTSLTEGSAGQLVDLATPIRVYQYCSSRSITGCNWLVPFGDATLCESCILTRTRPADDDADGLAEFLAAESAKRRLVFQLAEVGLPLIARDEQTQNGVAFDLLSSKVQKVVTGHDNGVITLDLSEADDEHRERLRLQLHEPYRTVLGHFRHEIGHYYWPILVHDRVLVDACRSLFGDDRADYSDAVTRHYETDTTTSWVESHVSQYATMHPYEDWAETFAHYLHIADTLQTAQSFNLVPTSLRTLDEPLQVVIASATKSTEATGFGPVVNAWIELSYALNQINQSMGHSDLYPFVLAPAVIRKLAFVDQVVRPFTNTEVK